jgi:hypothetical protein
MTGSKGSIAGTVVDATGAAVAGATVAVVSGSQPFPDIAAITGADGSFRLSGMVPGAYGIAARHGGAEGTAEVEATADEAANVEIVIA